jgi:hypothetical protein
MKVIYYYFYLFYSRILKVGEPHLSTRLVLSFANPCLSME